MPKGRGFESEGEDMCEGERVRVMSEGEGEARGRQVALVTSPALAARMLLVVSFLTVYSRL